MSSNLRHSLVDLTGNDSHNSGPTATRNIIIDLENLGLENTQNTEDDVLLVPRLRLHSPRQIAMLSPPITQLDHYRYASTGVTVRTNGAVELLNNDFLHVKSIQLDNATGEVMLMGYRLVRNEFLNGMLINELNEAVIYSEVELANRCDFQVQALIQVPLEQTLRPREVRFTNRQWPRWRAIKNGFTQDEEPLLEAEGGLTVRWKFLTVYESGAVRRKSTKINYKERVIQRIAASDATTNFSLAETNLRQAWRGRTILGGSYFPVMITNDAIQNSAARGSSRLPFNIHKGTALPTSHKRRYDQNETVTTAKRSRNNSSYNEMRLNNWASTNTTTSQPPANSLYSIPTNDVPLSGEVVQANGADSIRRFRARGQKYTHGDCFSGAGGSSRGAEMADLYIKFGFDFNEKAAEAWQMNFPNAPSFCRAADEFCGIADALSDEMIVDVLHLSPPCQPYSPAHTREGRDDEMNTASLFAVPEIIKRCKPRVVTLEETDWLARGDKSKLYFRALIHMLTAINFSVRWAVVDLIEWGLPQDRTRLIIIASCPGEILPQIPASTHSLNGRGGLKPYVSINKAIIGLRTSPRNDPDFRLFASPQPATDGSKPLRNTITCSGGLTYHPSGTRNYTVRELAALQGFPDYHMFTGTATEKKKQIGNAVPPVIAKVLFGSIVKELMQADGVIDDESILVE